MDHSKRRKNMLDTVAALKELLEPGLLGNYTWFEAVEVIAFSPTQATSDVLVRWYSRYVSFCAGKFLWNIHCTETRCKNSRVLCCRYKARSGSLSVVL